MCEPIILSKEQRDKLNKLWFIYGNHGKKCTFHNHKFIQSLLERGEDAEAFYRNACKERSDKAGVNWDTIKLTDECVNEVRLILNNK
jgi:hypothetical protein